MELQRVNIISVVEVILKDRLGADIHVCDLSRILCTTTWSLWVLSFHPTETYETSSSVASHINFWYYQSFSFILVILLIVKLQIVVILICFLLFLDYLYRSPFLC